MSQLDKSNFLRQPVDFLATGKIVSSTPLTFHGNIFIASRIIAIAIPYFKSTPRKWTGSCDAQCQQTVKYLISK